MVDISYGGMYYVIVPAASLGLDIHTCPANEVAAAGMTVLRATREAIQEGHPDGSDLIFPNGTILTDGQDKWSSEPSTASCVRSKTCAWHDRMKDRKFPDYFSYQATRGI